MYDEDKDPQYEVKTNLLFDDFRLQRFYAVYQLISSWIEDMLGFARFIEYDYPDVSPLYLARNEAEQVYLKERKENGEEIDGEGGEKFN